MRDDLTQDWFGDGQDPAAYDPARSARAGMKMPLPKRFYTHVSTQESADGHILLLNGKPARTKAKNLLAAPTPVLAEMLAQEWDAQVDLITPARMPLTRLLHAAIDSVAHTMSAVGEDMLAYAQTDLTCYRAAEPEGLVTLQNTHWNPVLDYIRTTYGARFVLVEGIMHAPQPPSAIEALRPRVMGITNPLTMASTHVLTTLSGSALIALMVADGALEAEAGFAAGELDADYTAQVWGKDEEAEARRAARLADFAAAARVLAALRG
jgi:chaperone required for assembly of F1-ATPase